MAKIPVNRYQQPHINPSQPVAGIRTKKYALDTKQYINLALREWIQREWIWFLIPAGVIVLNVILNVTDVYPNWWIYLVAVLGAIGFGLFRAMQFTATTQVEQNKTMFQKFTYEIDSRQILMKINQNEGGVIKWDMVKSARKEKAAYLLSLGRYQYLYLPFSIFNSDHDLKMMDTILRRKELMP
jgi:hypothetical protein